MARIKVGDMAPDFTFNSINLGEVSLSDYSGKPLVLIFGRYFGCPICQLDFDELLEYSPKIMKNAGLVYFTQSKRESAKLYLDKYPAEFPVVVVPEKNGRYSVYDDYGVGNMGLGTLARMLVRARLARSKGKTHGSYEGRETQSPGDFVVDGKGKVIWANRGLLELDKLQLFLNKL